MATTTSTNNTNLRKSLGAMKTKMRRGLDSLSTGSKNLGKYEANQLYTFIENRYNQFVSSLSRDHQDRSDTVFIIEPRDEYSYNVVGRGKQLIYDEFGTGDAGLLFPHPNKSPYGLNDYNSGEHIKTSKSGTHYWTYNSKDGWVNSSGVPSGQFMYGGVEDLLSDATPFTSTVVKNVFLRDLIKIINNK